MSTETTRPSRAALPPADRAPGFRRALAYEWTSFRTLRADRLLTGAALGVQLTMAAFAHDPRDHRDVTFDQVLSAVWVVGALITALGVTAFATEYRHRTITPTVLTVDPRSHVLLAKAVTVAAVAVVTQAVALAASWLVLATVHRAAPTPSTSFTLGAAFTGYIALTALVGLAPAALVRESALPIAALVMWPRLEVFVISRLDLPSELLTVLQPFHSARRIVAETPDRSSVLPLLVPAVLLLGAAAVSLTRRDV